MESNKDVIKKLYFDLMFSLFLILLLLVFFWASIDYTWASKRAPMVVMVPVIVMVLAITGSIVTKIRRIRAADTAGKERFKMDPADTAKGVQIVTWLVLLLLFFYVAGHLGGTALFLFVFIKFVSRENLRTAFLIGVGVAASIYVLFEKILLISLYEGWIYITITEWLYS